MGFGPLSVSTTSLMVSSPCPLPHSLRPLLHTARETPAALPAASSISAQIPPRFGAFPLRRLQSNRSGRNLSPAEHRACAARSEEHTSELQSLTNLVCRLLLEKKNTTKKNRQ